MNVKQQNINQETKQITPEFLPQSCQAIVDSFSNELLNINFDGERLLTMALQLMSNVRLWQDESPSHISKWWKEIYQSLRSTDNTVPEHELKLATSLVFDCTFVLLRCSKDSFYGYEINIELLKIENKNNPEGLNSRLEQMIDELEEMEAQISEWVDMFMDMEEEGTPIDDPEELKSHPLLQFIELVEYESAILKCLHKIIESKTDPKEQLAPIKAAIEYHPRLLSSNITSDVVNNEFRLDISKDTFNNWIKGYHGKFFSDEELKVYYEHFNEIFGK